MPVYLELNKDEPLSPKIDLIGDDELKDELILFLKHGIGESPNGFNSHYLSGFVFDTNTGHRWDFMPKDRSNTIYDGSISNLNLAWDCWCSARFLEKEK